MNIRFIYYFTLLLFLIFNPPTIFAGRIYMWIDKDGIRHASTSPPPSTKGITMIDQMSHKKDSPEEIRRYELQQKLRQRQNDLEAERQREIYQAKQAAEKSRADLKQYQKESELRRAKEALAFEEKYQQRYEDERLNAKSQWTIDMYDQLKRRQDKDVEEKRRKVMELENK